MCFISLFGVSWRHTDRTLVEISLRFRIFYILLSFESSWPMPRPLTHYLFLRCCLRRTSTCWHRNHRPIRLVPTVIFCNRARGPPHPDHVCKLDETKSLASEHFCGRTNLCGISSSEVFLLQQAPPEDFTGHLFEEKESSGQTE